MDISMTMRPAGRLSVACVFVFALAGPSAAHSRRHPEATSHPDFDGTYRVEITTTSGHGTCPPSFSGTVTVQNFRIVSLSDPQATASGGIEGDGTVSLALQRDGQIANAGGRIKGRTGKGFWSSPTAYCGGLWHAERQ